MYNLIAVSMGEIALKGKNRGYFEKMLVDRIKQNVSEFKNVKIYKDQGKVYLEPASPEDFDPMVEKVKKVFGIVLLSPCIKVEKNIDSIEEKIVKLFDYLLKNNNIKTFKIQTNRTDKEFPLKSLEINRRLGGVILDNFSQVTVDVHNPDIFVYVDIKTECYIYSERIKTAGGLPIGTNGKGLLLLSGGIDSPVAAYMMAKRGVKIEALYFHTYPFSSERANEKVKKLAELLEQYCGKIRLHSANMVEVHKAIKENCDERDTTILARRFMMRFAEKIARQNDISILITGESLGQVASQTIESMCVIENAVDVPIVKPVIGMDKTEIVEISKHIGTFETSILPYEDCCQIFAPKHPVTKPKLEAIIEEEKNLDIDSLMDTVMKTVEIK
ncbi:tRNA 4-thiouridine(8) synthase ThiI [Sedimentibacter sp. zth1]|uniref:tRNA uracil 4-sulfurtransferase ThiI n=1 Tax=Sedimentibacter sp. zth1 TaxID=2816908 RepID=UPI001A9295D5|nr:tRNA uracil 4-sulfurtransferase ThiI [Sedimentibacter sp. zth1]QSX06895.1 tRNA 4-thiouridine(8) synthase ThiI [Sedimentibacter sp. zth1]